MDKIQIPDCVVKNIKYVGCLLSPKIAIGCAHAMAAPGDRLKTHDFENEIVSMYRPNKADTFLYLLKNPVENVSFPRLDYNWKIKGNYFGVSLTKQIIIPLQIKSVNKATVNFRAKSIKCNFSATDSGSPIFCQTDSDLYLVSTCHHTTDGPNLSENLPAIKTAISVLTNE